MPKVTLTPQLVKAAVCPAGRKKEDLFDAACKGLLLEVRMSGGKTYHHRYQSLRGKTRTIKIADESALTLAQARTLVEKQRTQLAMGEDPQERKAELRSALTVAEFIHTKYLPFVKLHKRSWMTDECLLRNHIEPVWGRRFMDEITTDDLSTLIAKQRKTHAPGSCNRLIILARYMFNLALKWKLPGIKGNPTAGYPLLQENNKRERFLSAKEAGDLFEAIQTSPNPMLQFIVPMLIVTGARKREVLDAKWEDFDLISRAWRIPLAKGGKTRHVPLSDGALQILASIPKVEGCPWAFPNPDTGKPFVSVFCSWNAARKRAGLPEVRMHDLRHSFASFLINNGRTLYEVQKLLGHTQVKTTQRYAHLSKETLIDASNVVSGCIELRMPVVPGTPGAPRIAAAHNDAAFLLNDLRA